MMVPVGGAVDEPGLWAAICSDFDELRDEARRWGLGERWRSLVDSVRRGDPVAEDWIALRAELAELRGAAEDFAGRGEHRVRGDAAVSGYGCPARLCSRHVSRHPFGAPPRCALLRRDLVDLAQW
jgi:hypothetical protein